MGVKGLFEFLKKFERKVHIPDYVRDKSVGVDIFWFLHQSKGDFFALQNLLLPIIKHSAAVHCAFDGTAPPEKYEELRASGARRSELLDTIQRIESWLQFPFHRLNGESRQIIREYLADLRREAWIPTPEYIEPAKNWLRNKGCVIHQACGEADDLLIELESNGTIHTIITNDSDLLVLGARSVLRFKTPLYGVVFECDTLCENVGFTAQQWRDFMYLCRHMKNTDILLAYSFISVYKDLDYVLQKSYLIYDDYLIKEIC